MGDTEDSMARWEPPASCIMEYSQRRDAESKRFLPKSLALALMDVEAGRPIGKALMDLSDFAPNDTDREVQVKLDAAESSGAVAVCYVQTKWIPHPDEVLKHASSIRTDEQRQKAVETSRSIVS